MLVHGFGEHGGRYDAFARQLAAQGLTVACPDLWGHGRSSGRRGDIVRFADYVEDLDAFTRQVSAPLNPAARMAVFGHSFGGLVAVHWAIQGPRPWSCIILQSPLFGVGFPVPQWKARLSRMLGEVWPTLSMPTGLNPAWLSRDLDVARRYRNDPLVHHRITARGYAALQEAMQQAGASAERLTLPTLVLYGTADRVISVAACEAFAARMTCEKRIMGFPDCYHELHHESVASDVVGRIVEWIRAHE